VHAGGVGLQSDLLEIDAHGLADGPSVVGHYFFHFSVLVHEIAALSEFALVLLVEDLASSCAVQLAVSPRVLRPQFLDTVCEATAILVGTIPFFHEIFAQFHFDLPVLGRRSFGGGGSVAFAGLEGVALWVVLFSMLGFGGEGEGGDRVKGSVGGDLPVFERVALALARRDALGLQLTDVLGHWEFFSKYYYNATNVFPFGYEENGCPNTKNKGEISWNRNIGKERWWRVVEGRRLVLEDCFWCSIVHWKIAFCSYIRIAIPRQSILTFPIPTLISFRKYSHNLPLSN
jgi:hypothetical protein